MKIILSLLNLALLIVCVNGADLFDMPEGWAQSPRLNLDGTEISVLEQYKSADRSIQVTVAKHPPVESFQDKINAVASIIRGMKNKGYAHGSTSIESFKGYDTRHIQGEFKIEGYEDVFLADTYLVFCDETMLTVSISVTEDATSREVSRDLMSRLNIEEVFSPVENIVVSTNNFWEDVGYYGFYVILALGIYCIYQREKKNKPQNKIK